MQADPDLMRRMRDGLERSKPDNASAERDVLETALRVPSATRTQADPEEIPQETCAGIQIRARPGRAVLTGQGVTEDFLRDLDEWLQAR